MDRSSLLFHLLSCPCVAVICCNSDSGGGRCGVQCRRSELAKHQAVCDMKTAPCVQGCGCELTVTETEAGAHNCVKYLKQHCDKEIASLKTEYNTAINALTSSNLILTGSWC